MVLASFLQVLLFDDCLRSDDREIFKDLADDRQSCSPDMNELTLLFACAKRAVLKHSVRATRTSAEVH